MHPNTLVYITLLVLNAIGLVFVLSLRPKPEFRPLQALIAATALISIIVCAYGLYLL